MQAVKCEDYLWWSRFVVLCVAHRANGNSLTVQEWQHFLVRKLRKYHVLSEDIMGEEGAMLDPTPVDLGDGRGAVDFLNLRSEDLAYCSRIAS